MNLITDCWMSIIRECGGREKIAPWQIVELDNPVIEIDAPRADFQGALYQFLIGLLQTCLAPEDEDEWVSLFKAPPEAEKLKTILATYIDAFFLDEPGKPGFFQEFDNFEADEKTIAGLMVEAPGKKTEDDHLDHFIKSGYISGICLSCLPVALYTIQANSPPAGAGYRVGLRGGGPLTTLILPQTEKATLWQKLWLNVLSQEDFCATAVGLQSEVFPWLASTRISDKAGVSTTPEDVSPMQMYWSMPRRIRFDFTNADSGHCDICGEYSERIFRSFRTRNYGVNYEGPWMHPLTPYRIDSANKQPPLSLKGQQGGLGYRHWLGLCWQDQGNGDQAARVTRVFNEERARRLHWDNGDASEIARLWCFGYDMDNMKARCWYEQHMPLVYVDSAYRETFLELVGHLIFAAKDVLPLLRGQIKQAWFSRPKDAKGDTSMIDRDFWEATEGMFYLQLNQLAKQSPDIRFMPSDIAVQWVNTLRQTAHQVFDFWVLEGPAEDMDMKRITQARSELSKKLCTIKTMKALDQWASAEKKEVNHD